MLANTAGIDDDNVGFVLDVGQYQAVHFQQSSNAFGIVVVHLTPKGAQEVFANHRLMSLPPCTWQPCRWARRAHPPTGELNDQITLTNQVRLVDRLAR